MDSSQFFADHDALPQYNSHLTPLITRPTIPHTPSSDTTPSPSSSFSSGYCSTPITPVSRSSSYDRFCNDVSLQLYLQQAQLAARQYPNGFTASSFAPPPAPVATWHNQQWQSTMPFRQAFPQDTTTFTDYSLDESLFNNNITQTHMTVDASYDASLVSIPSDPAWSFFDEGLAATSAPTANAAFRLTPPNLGDSFSPLMGDFSGLRDSSLPWSLEQSSSGHGNCETVAPSAVCKQAIDDCAEQLKAEAPAPPSYPASEPFRYPTMHNDSTSLNATELNRVKRKHLRRAKRSSRAKSESTESFASASAEPLDFDRKGAIRCEAPGCGLVFQRGEHYKRHTSTVHDKGAEAQCPLRELGGSDWCKIELAKPPRANNGPSKTGKGASRAAQKKAGISRQDNRLQHMGSHCCHGGRNATCQPAFLEYLIRTLEEDTAEKCITNLFAGIERQLRASALFLLDRLLNGATQKRRIFEISNDISEIQTRHPMWADYQRSYAKWRMDPVSQDWSYCNWDELFELQAWLKSASAAELEAFINTHGLRKKKGCKVEEEEDQVMDSMHPVGSFIKPQRDQSRRRGRRMARL